MRGHPTALAVLATCCASIGCWLLGASSAQASGDPLNVAAGVYKLGDGAGTGSTGIPYALADGTTGTLTARHAVGDPSATHWSITDAAGDAGYGVVRTASRAVDTAFLQGSGQWAASPKVALSSDYFARFAASAKSPADVVTGDRICRTGWSPLDGTGAASAGSPNLNAAPDIAPSAGASVICGRVTSVQRNSFWIGNSDRPDGAIIAQGDSGGMVWKITGDHAFMFLGLMTDASVPTSTSVDGFATYQFGQVQAAWGIDRDPLLAVHPLLAPSPAPFFVIAASTYHPQQGSNATLQGSLRDRAGNPIADAPVQVLAGSRLAVVGTTTTNVQGNLVYPTGMVRTATQFAFRWDGAGNRQGTTSRVITVSPTRAVIDNATSTVPYGTALNVAAHIADASGAPVAARTVVLRIYSANGTPGPVVATATTNAQGAVVLTGSAVTRKQRYAVSLVADPVTNGDPYGVATSPVLTITPV